MNNILMSVSLCDVTNGVNFNMIISTETQFIFYALHWFYLELLNLISECIILVELCTFEIENTTYK